MTLDHKVILITGASSGIGEATALACARQGATVALAARRKDRLEALAERIGEETGEHASVWQVDVTDEWQARAFVNKAVEHHGRFDALINNAGIMLLGPHDAPVQDWQRMVHTNVFGSLYTTHAAVPIMREQGHGDLVFLGSVLGRATEPLSAVYCLTKFGITAFADSLRKEVAHTGIRVCVVEPGRVDTELRSHITPHPGLAEVFPAFDGIRPSWVADSIVYTLQQPESVSVSEILIRPSVSRL